MNYFIDLVVTVYFEVKVVKEDKGDKDNRINLQSVQSEHYFFLREHERNENNEIILCKELSRRFSFFSKSIALYE